MTMLLFDASRFAICVLFLIFTLRFFYLSLKTVNSVEGDNVTMHHFIEHLVATAFSFLGSIIGSIYSFIHLFIGKQGELPEYPFTISLFLIVISGILFMIHMIKEQTPGHPFYMREYGLSEQSEDKT